MLKDANAKDPTSTANKIKGANRNSQSRAGTKCSAGMLKKDTERKAMGRLRFATDTNQKYFLELLMYSLSNEIGQDVKNERISRTCYKVDVAHEALCIGWDLYLDHGGLGYGADDCAGN